MIAAPAGGRRGGGGRRKADDITFDDDDVLGGMGLESPRPSKVIDKDEQERQASKSFLNNLMGKDSSVSKHLERPGTGDSKKEFVLDKKYSK